MCVCVRTCVCMCLFAWVYVNGTVVLNQHLAYPVHSFHPQGIVLKNHSLPALQPAQRRMVYFSVMETIARLHRLPLGELEVLLDPQKAHSDMRTFWNWQVPVHCMFIALCVCVCVCVCVCEYMCAHAHLLMHVPVCLMVLCT